MTERGRRKFLAQIATTGLAAGTAPFWEIRTEEAHRTRGPFVPGGQGDEAAVFAAARRELLIPEEVTFCNTATYGASPREVVDATTEAYRMVERDLPDWAYRPNDETDDPLPPSTGYRPLRTFREEIGTLINAPADELALTQNTTMGMSILANGLDLEPGDEIVTTDQEHGGGISPWMLRQRRHGAVVRQVALGPAVEDGPDGVVAAFADQMTARTRVVMFSHVTSLLGIKLPAAELCALARRHDALSVVDGAQAVGQMPVDVAAIGCDAYVTSGHKWLLGPKGTGLLYVRGDVQDRFWGTLVTGGFENRSQGAFRLARFGTGSLPRVFGLRAAVRFMKRLDIDRIERWDRSLTSRLREGLASMPHVRLSSPVDPRLSAAVTTFAVSGRTADEMQDVLWREKIRVRAEGDAGIRLSAHFYVAPADIDRVLSIVRSFG
jgi:selenocysteine lyase/cysteine desulfurase